MIPQEDAEETQLLAALLGIAEMVGELPDSEEVLGTIVRIAPSLVKVDRCALLTYDEAAREFRTLASFGPPGAPSYDGLVLCDADIPRLSQRLVKQRLPVVMKEASKDPLLPPAVTQRLGLRSVLIAPLVCRGRFLGAMWLDSTSAPHHFTSKEINVVLGVATEAAITLDASRSGEVLANERRRFAALAAALCDGVVLVGPDLRIASLDAGAEALLGWTTSETRGRRFADVFELTDAEAAVSWTRDAGGPSTVPKTLTLRTRDGRRVSCRVAAAVVRDEAGGIAEVLFTLNATPAETTPDSVQRADGVTLGARPE